MTNLEADSRAVARFYDKSGTAERWIKEGKQGVELSVIAYNLGNLWRRLVLPRRIGKPSLASLQQRLMSMGGRLIKYARYYWLLLVERHLTRRLFGAMVRPLESLPLPAG